MSSSRKMHGSPASPKRERRLIHHGGVDSVTSSSITDRISSSRHRKAATSSSSSSSHSSAASVGSSTKTRMFVDHTYHDHLHDPRIADPSACAVSLQELQKPQPKGTRGGVTVQFPSRLYNMLTHVDKEGLQDIISWQPHGRSFVIRDKNKFVDDIMPRFFQQTKITSFQRQLNLYGFQRLTAGRDRGGYYHEYFLRSREDLCKRIMRTRVKGIGMKAASSPGTEPNFYSMEACPETVTTFKPTKTTSSASDEDSGSEISMRDGHPEQVITDDSMSEVSEENDQAMEGEEQEDGSVSHTIESTTAAATAAEEQEEEGEVDDEKSAENAKRSSTASVEKAHDADDESSLHVISPLASPKHLLCPPHPSTLIEMLSIDMNPLGMIEEDVDTNSKPHEQGQDEPNQEEEKEQVDGKQSGTDDLFGTLSMPMEFDDMEAANDAYLKSGDPVTFEGLQFRYLDKFDVIDELHMFG